MKIASKVLIVSLCAALMSLASAAYASNHDYYKGKTVRFIVAFSAGGTFDAYTRVIRVISSSMFREILLSWSRT
jgi:tripartite-type tricarboxylate transporter receptor subunit TctC